MHAKWIKLLHYNLCSRENTHFRENAKKLIVHGVVAVTLRIDLQYVHVDINHKQIAHNCVWV